MASPLCNKRTNKRTNKQEINNYLTSSDPHQFGLSGCKNEINLDRGSNTQKRSAWPTDVPSCLVDRPPKPPRLAFPGSIGRRHPTLNRVDWTKASHSNCNSRIRNLVIYNIVFVDSPHCTETASCINLTKRNIMGHLTISKKLKQATLTSRTHDSILASGNELINLIIDHPDPKCLAFHESMDYEIHIYIII